MNKFLMTLLLAIVLLAGCGGYKYRWLALDMQTQEQYTGDRESCSSIAKAHAYAGEHTYNERVAIWHSVFRECMMKRGYEFEVIEQKR